MFKMKLENEKAFKRLSEEYEAYCKKFEAESSHASTLSEHHTPPDPELEARVQKLEDENAKVSKDFELYRSKSEADESTLKSKLEEALSRQEREKRAKADLEDRLSQTIDHNECLNGKVSALEKDYSTLKIEFKSYRQKTDGGPQVSSAKWAELARVADEYESFRAEMKEQLEAAKKKTLQAEKDLVAATSETESQLQMREETSVAMSQMQDGFAKTLEAKDAKLDELHHQCQVISEELQGARNTIHSFREQEGAFKAQIDTKKERNREPQASDGNSISFQSNNDHLS